MLKYAVNGIRSERNKDSLLMFITWLEEASILMGLEWDYPRNCPEGESRAWLSDRVSTLSDNIGIVIVGLGKILKHFQAEIDWRERCDGRDTVQCLQDSHHLGTDDDWQLLRSWHSYLLPVIFATESYSNSSEIGTHTQNDLIGIELMETKRELSRLEEEINNAKLEFIQYYANQPIKHDDSFQSYDSSFSSLMELPSSQSIQLMSVDHMVCALVDETVALRRALSQSMDRLEVYCNDHSSALQRCQYFFNRSNSYFSDNSGSAPVLQEFSAVTPFIDQLTEYLNELQADLFNARSETEALSSELDNLREECMRYFDASIGNDKQPPDEMPIFSLLRNVVDQSIASDRAMKKFIVDLHCAEDLYNTYLRKSTCRDHFDVSDRQKFSTSAPSSLVKDLIMRLDRQQDEIRHRKSSALKLEGEIRRAKDVYQHFLASKFTSAPAVAQQAALYSEISGIVEYLVSEVNDLAIANKKLHNEIDRKYEQERQHNWDMFDEFKNRSAVVLQGIARANSTVSMHSYSDYFNSSQLTKNSQARFTRAGENNWDDSLNASNIVASSTSYPNTVKGTEFSGIDKSMWDVVLDDLSLKLRQTETDIDFLQVKNLAYRK